MRKANDNAVTGAAQPQGRGGKLRVACSRLAVSMGDVGDRPRGSAQRPRQLTNSEPRGEITRLSGSWSIQFDR